MIFYCRCKLCIKFQTIYVLNFKQKIKIYREQRGSKRDVIITLAEANVTSQKLYLNDSEFKMLKRWCYLMLIQTVIKRLMFFYIDVEKDQNRRSSNARLQKKARFECGVGKLVCVFQNGKNENSLNVKLCNRKKRKREFQMVRRGRVVSEINELFIRLLPHNFPALQSFNVF